MQVFVFLLQDRMWNFPKKRQRKACTRVEFGPLKIDGHSMVTVLLFLPNTQDMHKITVLSSICKICATLYRSTSIFQTPIGDEKFI